ncbi:FAD-binding oxidoreductase [Bradyrhizobium manausense]|uniref:NAD(P)/FAD-dependent oxidoreductase n=1 Tax=Bradyrhizobium TaxID=374 RepID=UPI001BADE1C4|nr:MULTISPECIES: FAD-binding oxidoreductase [Bradyrhizobium]MBR0828339.1 FAD-binding oxidoreductase [Bradyrhizobium manausense]UVO25594.1 FAD-binding oxidoreductase [Bradyrhizobium arachidis]
MKSVIVLGGGMVGVSAALHLQRSGWSVTLVDRKEPGQETSYGNAGIVQSEAVRPYPMPRDLGTLLRIAMGRTNDVRYRLASLSQHIEPLLRYWWHSAPQRHREATAAWARLIAYATPEHDVLIREAHADNLVRRAGYRLLHRDPAAFELAIKAAEENQRDYGVQFRVLDGRELAKAEPLLRDDLPGAIHWLEPWTVSDPGGLVAAYARLFQRLGGKLLRGDAQTLSQTSSGWSVDTDEGPIDAEAAVVSLGPWSPDLLQKFGYRVPLVRKRGYHMHYQGGTSLDLPLVDTALGYAMAPMAKGIRITTGAELTSPDAPATPIQLGHAEAAARTLLDLGTRVEPEPWFGTRPCTPDMLPVLGPAPRHRGLWLDFGHGHQGFTLGPATGRLLAEMMNGGATSIDPKPYRVDRF